MEGFKKPSCKIEVPHMLLMAAWPQKKENNKETTVYGGKISPLALLFFFRLSGILPLAFSSLPLVLLFILGEQKRISIVLRGWC